MPLTKRLLKLLSLFLPLILIACGSTSTPTPSPVISEPTGVAPTGMAPIESPVDPTPEPSAKPAAASLVLLQPDGTDFSQLEELESTLAGFAQDQGLRFEVRDSLQPQELTPEIQAVVALPPDPGIADLAAAAPKVRFLALGIPGLEPTQNLTVIGPEGASADMTGFLAGYIAAVITSEWRVGVLSASDSPQGLAARNGYRNGVVYFCGLCRQTYPPYHDYPLSVELPTSASTAEWQSAVDTLGGQMVETVYVGPGAYDPELLDYLAQSGFNILASVPPPAGLQNNWVASLGPDYLEPLREHWSGFIQGNPGAKYPVGLQIEGTNDNLFSPGRQKLVLELMADLQNGYIDTGVDPSTGEIR
jgi:hypothetical protein